MIKRRLQYTASFCVMVSGVASSSVMMCAFAMASASVGCSSALVCYACAVSDQRKMIVLSARECGLIWCRP